MKCQRQTFFTRPLWERVGTKVTQGFFAWIISTLLLRFAGTSAFCPNIDALLCYPEWLRSEDCGPVAIAQLPLLSLFPLDFRRVELLAQPIDSAELLGIMVLDLLRK